jgi:hypothetical protein
MGLTSTATVVASALLTVTSVATCFLLWNRLPGRRVAQLAGRVGLVLSCQLLAVAVAGLTVNARYGLYSSWSELLGRSALTIATAAPISGKLDHAHIREVRAAFHAGHGTVVLIVVRGTASGVPPQRALVYLPSAYGDPASPFARFPVVELLHGFPGRPESWTNALHLQAVLDAQIASRRSVPVIAVMPMQNVAFPRDTQCVDVIGGPRVDTFLTVDVHRAVVTGFRAAVDRFGWALMGYSTGGSARSIWPCGTRICSRQPCRCRATRARPTTIRPAISSGATRR